MVKGVMRHSDMDLGHDAPQTAASGPPPQQGVLSSARPLGNQLPMRTTCVLVYLLCCHIQLYLL